MVDCIRIEDGTMSLRFVDGRHVIKRKRPFSELRVRSRQANLTDCTCFLRPGIDVCVLIPSKDLASSDEANLELVLIDAKIRSIERKPHESQCSCQFYVNLYVNQGPLGSEKLELDKDTKVLGIDQILILQRLEKHPCEGQYYRWSLSEDCSSLSRTKLFLGKFSSDLSWLLVASVLKQVAFEVRTEQYKIVYQILADDDGSPSKSNNYISAVSFREDNGLSVSNLFQFTPADSIQECRASGEPRPCSSNGGVELRCSKRRNVQPERFIGGQGLTESDSVWVRQMPIKTDKWKEEDEMFLPLSRLFKMQPLYLKEQPKNETRDLVVYKSNKYSKDVKSGLADQVEHQNKLAIIPVPNVPELEPEPLASEHHDYHANLSANNSKRVEELSFRYNSLKCSRTSSRKKFSQIDDMDLVPRWEGIQGKGSNRKAQIRKHRGISSKEDFDEPITYKKKSLSAGAYDKLIHSYMKNIDSTMIKEEPHIIDQWQEFKKASFPEQRMEIEQSSSEDEGESSENEMLWREMELSMASAYFLEDNEVRVSYENIQKTTEVCQHSYRLNEEIGMCCLLCGFISTEIKYMTAPFMEFRSYVAENRWENEEDNKNMTYAGRELNLVGNHTSHERLLTEENDNVWALIPELRNKLHLHQKRAYEFLWRNIAGDLVPAQMESKSDNIGGCVVSHSPGAGKTFLIIAFLVSYLKLFPGKRPLVLAPKTTLYTWHKEFIKWKIPIPVHLIHGRRSYRIIKQKTVKFQGVPRPSQDVMHVLDCLEKIHKWHAEPSVLVMGYTSFLTLMREDAKFAHRKYMAKVLRESPGLLVLDEGHNPRSTKSRLRKVLMKVETDLRILLSGTLFQNNFCEYFNTLCLARPKFVNEVLMELDPKFKNRKRKVEKARHLLEARARKFFLDTIAKKIDSGIGDERKQGINMLKNITSGFIDMYEGGGSDTLPGLQIYTLLMNVTEMQHHMLVELHDIMSGYDGYPLELELLITLASMHPWLVKTSNCVSRFFSEEALTMLEKVKYEPKKGTKVMFVLNLVYRVVQKEKVLIFCHNIAPIRLFLELFEIFFGWQRGRELLVLTGDLELFERGRVMDKFEEPGGSSKVLLASITACAEGISLTAASRVIFLDSEWNPSKTKQAMARAFRPGQQKVVYVYQLLATGTLEEDKYKRTTWKDWVSSMIFSEEFVEDPSQWQLEKIEDDVLREIVEEDRSKSFHKLLKIEKTSTI